MYAKYPMQTPTKVLVVNGMKIRVTKAGYEYFGSSKSIRRTFMNNSNPTDIKIGEVATSGIAK